MIEVKPKQRLSVDAMLAHPWLQIGHDARAVPLSSKDERLLMSAFLLLQAEISLASPAILAAEPGTMQLIQSVWQNILDEMITTRDPGVLNGSFRHHPPYITVFVHMPVSRVHYAALPPQAVQAATAPRACINQCDLVACSRMVACSQKAEPDTATCLC